MQTNAHTHETRITRIQCCHRGTLIGQMCDGKIKSTTQHPMTLYNIVHVQNKTQ